MDLLVFVFHKKLFHFDHHSWRDLWRDLTDKYIIKDKFQTEFVYYLANLCRIIKPKQHMCDKKMLKDTKYADNIIYGDK